MTFLEALAVLAAGFAASGSTSIVGGGSLITFPVLLAVGYPSVVANVSNTDQAKSSAMSTGCVRLTGASSTAQGGGARLAPAPRSAHSSAASCCSTLPEAVFDTVVADLILFLLAVVDGRIEAAADGLRSEPQIRRLGISSRSGSTAATSGRRGVDPARRAVASLAGQVLQRLDAART